MRKNYRLLLFGGVILFVLLGAAMIVRGTSEEGGQPIAFNHKLHKQSGAECIDCHRFYESERNAGRPTVQDCLACHDEAITEDREAVKIRAYADDNKEIPWKRLYRMPDHVFFTHRRHVVQGGVPCKTCHGGIGEMTEPPSKPLKTLSMSDCMNCHRKTGADNDCLACHW
jgi:hypothetical protein